MIRTGESSTEPTELIFVLKRNSSPICFMISRTRNRSAVAGRPVIKSFSCHTFVRHVNLPRLADYLRNVLGIFDCR